MIVKNHAKTSEEMIHFAEISAQQTAMEIDRIADNVEKGWNIKTMVSLLRLISNDLRKPLQEWEV